MNPSFEAFRQERQKLLSDLHAKYCDTARSFPDQWKIHTSQNGGMYSPKSSRIDQMNKILEVGDHKALSSIITLIVKTEQGYYISNYNFLKPSQNICIITDSILKWVTVIGDNIPDKELLNILPSYSLEDLRVLAKRYIDSLKPDLISILSLDKHMLDLLWQFVGLPMLRTHELFDELEPFIPQLQDIYRKSGLDFNLEFHLVSPYALVEMRQESTYEGDYDSMTVGRCEGDHYKISVNHRDHMTLHIIKELDFIPDDI